MVRTSAGFSPQSLHVRIGLGSKLEKTSFLKSLWIAALPFSNSTKHQSEQLFLIAWAELQSGMERKRR
jgi:hypothetical protein